MKFFSDMKLRTQAVAATGSIVLLALIMNTALSMSATASKYREAVMGRTTALAEGIRKDIDKVLGFGLQLDALDGMNENLESLKQVDPDIALVMILDRDGKVLYATDRDLLQTTLTDKATKQALAAEEPLVQEYSSRGQDLIEKAFPLSGVDGKPIGVFRIALRAAAVDRQLHALLVRSLIVVVLSFGIATWLASIFMRRTITGPVGKMAEAAARLASGELQQQVSITGNNEIAQLGSAINRVSVNLREMLGRVNQTTSGLADAMKLTNESIQKMSRGARVQHEAGEQTAMTVNEMNVSIKGVADNAAEMSSSASDASASASEMVASIEEVAENAGGLSAAAEDTATSIVETLASIRQVSENTDALSSAAEQTSASITQMGATVKAVEQKAQESARLAEKVARNASDQGLAAASEAQKGMENIRATVETTADVINRLGKRSQEIGQILKVIDEVTDQTSLLALNAAILAAQAGEHGKGFAVVAEEIRELADRTAASTKEIANVIAAVQQDTAASIQAMSKGMKAVEEGSDLVRVTGDVFGHVSDLSKQAADMARGIELTTAEQTKGVSQINDAAANIAEQIEHIAQAMQEQRKGSERIAQAAEKMRDITRQMKVATREQTMASKQIAKAVDAVTEQAAQVARSTSEQTLGAQQISDAIARIQKITEENVDVSVEMDMAEAALREKAEALQEELKKFRF